jgi:hypothetical protein
MGVMAPVYPAPVSPDERPIARKLALIALVASITALLATHHLLSTLGRGWGVFFWISGMHVAVTASLLWVIAGVLIIRSNIGFWLAAVLGLISPGICAFFFNPFALFAIAKSPVVPTALGLMTGLVAWWIGRSHAWWLNPPKRFRSVHEAA